MHQEARRELMAAFHQYCRPHGGRQRGALPGALQLLFSTHTRPGQRSAHTLIRGTISGRFERKRDLLTGSGRWSPGGGRQGSESAECKTAVGALLGAFCLPSSLGGRWYLEMRTEFCWCRGQVCNICLSDRNPLTCGNSCSKAASVGVFATRKLGGMWPLSTGLALRVAHLKEFSDAFSRTLYYFMACEACICFFFFFFYLTLTLQGNAKRTGALRRLWRYQNTYLNRCLNSTLVAVKQ